jgi:hypothetical protein
MQTGKYNEQIGCTVVSYSYDEETKAGKLHLKKDSECDMTGTIKAFQSIDPLVEIIQVYKMRKEDVIYKRQNRHWQVVDSKSGTIISEFKECCFGNGVTH